MARGYLNEDVDCEGVDLGMVVDEDAMDGARDDGEVG